MHATGDWARLGAVMGHEFGHHVAFRYGTQAELGAAPEGWPPSGATPVETWADCVSNTFTGYGLQRTRAPGRRRPGPTTGSRPDRPPTRAPADSSERLTPYDGPSHGGVAQLARAPALQAGSRGFESHRLHPMTSIQWLDDETARIDDVEFVCTARRISSTPDRFFLAKRPDLVSRYARFLEDHNPSTMIELGVLQGGSTAFAALAHHPSKLMAFERSPERVEALDTLLERKALTSTVRVHYGIDQADRSTLHDHLTAEGIGTRQTIDLVVDDASHLVEPTRASFETLFPFLRPGGIYIVEDWAWAHVGYGLHRPDERPLSAFVLEAAFAAAGRPDVVANVIIDRDWASITRGRSRPTDRRLLPHPRPLQQSFTRDAPDSRHEPGAHLLHLPPP